MSNFLYLSFKPLTYRQALAVCKEYQNLIGKSFDPTEHWNEVECVAVAPYDEINKWIFTRYYSDLKSPVKALEYYEGHFYDVVVIARSRVDRNWCVCKDIKTYLEQTHAPV